MAVVIADDDGAYKATLDVFDACVEKEVVVVVVVIVIERVEILELVDDELGAAPPIIGLELEGDTEEIAEIVVDIVVVDFDVVGVLEL